MDGLGWIYTGWFRYRAPLRKYGAEKLTISVQGEEAWSNHAKNIIKSLELVNFYGFKSHSTCRFSGNFFIIIKITIIINIILNSFMVGTWFQDGTSCRGSSPAQIVYVEIFATFATEMQ